MYTQLENIAKKGISRRNSNSAGNTSKKMIASVKQSKIPKFIKLNDR
jgi:hypothetical protein